MVKAEEAMNYTEILDRLKRQVMAEVRAELGNSEGQESEEIREAQTKERGETAT